jgi:ferrous iron transport protein B
MFNNLTGAYATVSNYPGTTVEVTRGKTRIGAHEFEVVDTPGMYSLLPVTEEERVARAILLEQRPQIVLHMVDAKNLERMLVFTVQLIEAGMPTILILNMMDELEKLGKQINVTRLEEELNIPVVPTVSTSGRGMDILRGKIEQYVAKNYPEDQV